jgi:hypothetical protein
VSRRRHRVGWLVREHGNPEQPAGRHTAEYLAANREGGVGMYPMGQSMRVPRRPWDDLDGDLERLNNDPHQRYTLAEVMPGARA